jgi:hypothetical protein
MPVALVVVIVVAWLVILVPGLLRRRSASGETDSISHFHQQLRILEHSAPEPIVAPAYRLCVADDATDAVRSNRPPTLTVVGARDLPRPALAFLADPLDDPAPPAFDPADEPAVDCRPGSSFDVRCRAGVDIRRLARQRRRDTLGVLVLAFLVSLMIGFVPGASVAWAATGVLGATLVAYVILLVRLRRLAAEREQKLHYLRPPSAGTLAGLAALVEGDQRDRGMSAAR